MGHIAFDTQKGLRKEHSEHLNSILYCNACLLDICLSCNSALHNSDLNGLQVNEQFNRMRIVIFHDQTALPPQNILAEGF